MGPPCNVDLGSVGHGLAGVVGAEGQCLGQEFVAHPAVQCLAVPMSHMGLPSAMECHFTFISSTHSRIAFEVNSVPLHVGNEALEKAMAARAALKLRSRRP
jgi:hypothetical protein